MHDDLELSLGDEGVLEVVVVEPDLVHPVAVQVQEGKLPASDVAAVFLPHVAGEDRDELSGLAPVDLEPDVQRRVRQGSAEG